MNQFELLKGWTTKFEIDGKFYGGDLDLCNDKRLVWHLNTEDVEYKSVLELGPLEGAHTKTLEHNGALVTAIEGDGNNFLKCLVVKNAFNLDAQFIYGDFCEFIEKTGAEFDIILAAGVLYHQKNPAKLIYDMARITDTVFVWSQVASGKSQQNEPDSVVESNGREYIGKKNKYGQHSDSYCAGLGEYGFWLYREEMITCFKDAGFTSIIMGECPDNVNGETILFTAKKHV
jgi:SAM-dependent methyltransferase